ncbi:helix-turn-helix domain-containing protein [Streptomyces bambusae]|nr:helix-turn-helix transcriptional regulator [Streptomyces bambusae]
MTTVVHDDDGGEQENEVNLDEELRSFGRLIKAFRKKTGLTQQDLAEQIRYSVEYVGSVEQGRRHPSERFVARVEETLGAYGVIHTAFREVSRRRGMAAWFLRWAELEDGALTLNTYECRVVPGLLQTEDYARALIRNVPPLPDAEEEQARVQVRLARQQLLRRTPYVQFSFIIEEAVLERQIGGPEVTAALLDHLLLCAALPNVDLQIMPKVCHDHAGTDGSFQLLETEENEWVGYIEGHKTGRVISDPKAVSVLHQRYAKLRIQALKPAESMSLLKEMRGSL